MEKFGDKAHLIHKRNNWMIEVRKKARQKIGDDGDLESFPEFLLAIEVGELFGMAIMTRLSRIPSDLFEKGHSTKKLHEALTKLLKDDAEKKAKGKNKG